jgi:pimeloyl-ACP methyl ester carboxylesterase
VTIDATEPGEPVELGHSIGGIYKKRLTLLPDIGIGGAKPLAFRRPVLPGPGGAVPCGGLGPSFTGDLAVTTSWNDQSSYISFFDVTDPASPCHVSNKVLTANPDQLSDFTKRGTVHAIGYPRGIAALAHDSGYAAFAAVGELGIMGTDVTLSFPEALPGTNTTPTERIVEGQYPGDFMDVVVSGDKLFAVRRDPNALDVLDTTLSRLASVDLPDRPRRMVFASGFPFDVDGDGRIAPREGRDLVFVAGETAVGAGTYSIQIVDVGSPTAPRVIGQVPMPGIIVDLDVDPARQKLLAAGDAPAIPGAAAGAGAIYLVDVSKPEVAQLIDNDGDPQHLDDRILWHTAYPARPNGVRLDPDRGLAYVAASYRDATFVERGALDVWAIYDQCCDPGVDLTAEHADSQLQIERQALLEKERTALQAGIRKGLADAASCGGATSGIAMLEQGSGACIWRNDCDRTYQPGVSDHDFEVLFASLPPDAAQVPADVSCVITSLNKVFADPSGIEFTSGGGTAKMAFEDVTFYAASRDAIVRGRLNLHPPVAAGGADPGGDLGMGRQSLLLKWILEGEYVKGVPGFDLEGPPLDSSMERLQRAPSGSISDTGIPLLEGYEWSRLMQYNLAKAQAYIRIKGASASTSAFHDLYVKQLHDVAKAGIRAAMGRLVADREANRRLVQLTSRSDYRSPAGCLDMDDPANVAPSSWPPAKCTSFEQYVASAAATVSASMPAPLFNVADLNLIARFYRVKSDKEELPGEAAADAFVRDAADFITRAVIQTQPVYAATVNVDAATAGTRLANMGALVGPAGILSPGGVGGKLKKALEHGSLHVVPRFFNQGFREADHLLAVMYRKVDSGSSPTEVKSLRVTLAGGESRHLRYVETATPIDEDVTTDERNLNDLARGEKSPRQKAFVLGDGTAANPFVDQQKELGVAHGVAVTIDLPSLSGEKARTMKERDRINNFTGFSYYVLDTTGTVVPNPPLVPILPLSAGDLAGDAECTEAPALQILTQNLVAGTQTTLHVTLKNTSTQTLHNVQVCSKLAVACVTVATVAPNQLVPVVIPFAVPPDSVTVGSIVTVSGKDASGRSVKVTWTDQLLSFGDPFAVTLWDATPMSEMSHPFSRYWMHRPKGLPERPVKGVTTDGTPKALRIVAGGCVAGQQSCLPLQPGGSVTVRIVDARTGKVEPGIGTLVLGPTSATEIVANADSSGKVELFYTPPSFFIRDTLKAHDFDAPARAVRVTVSQVGTGTSSTDIVLRRPPVFLIGGLFGTIDDWKDLQPLVPKGQVLQKFKSFKGFHDHFDVFTVGIDNAADRFEFLATHTAREFRTSLQAYEPADFAVGKVDVIGHSMGGVLTRKLVTDDPKIKAVVRKLIALNSPFKGSPVADRVVEIRDNLAAHANTVRDFFSPDAPADPALKKAKLDFLCAGMVTAANIMPGISINRGAVDDLRTALIRDGQLTELGKLDQAGIPVPMHVITDQFTSTGGSNNPLTAFGVHDQVKALWAVLGWACNLTPEEDTREATRVVQASADIGLALVSAGVKVGSAALGAVPKLTGVGLVGSALQAKSAGELAFGEAPVPVFEHSPNDRVVLLSSQFGGIPSGSGAITADYGRTDHLESKRTGGITFEQCATNDASGWHFNNTSPVSDLNGDQSPDPACRMAQLLEADPQGPMFHTSSGSSTPLFEVHRIIASVEQAEYPGDGEPGVPAPPPPNTYESTSRSYFMDAFENPPLALPRGLRDIRFDCELEPGSDENLQRWRIQRNQVNADVPGPDGPLDDPADHFEWAPLVAYLAAPTPAMRGSFNVICYGDLNLNGQVDPGEPRRVLNLALVEVKVNSLVADPTVVEQPASNRGDLERLVVSVGNPTAMTISAQVTLSGGGPNQTIGVDEISLFFAQNIESELQACEYDGGRKITTVYEETAAPPEGPNPSGDPPVICDGAPELIDPPFPPILDAEHWSPTGRDSIQVAPGQTIEGPRERKIEMKFGRENVCPVRHPCPPQGGTPNAPWLRATRGGTNYVDYLMSYSLSFARQSQMATTAYAVHARAKWEYRDAGTVSYVPAQPPGEVVWNPTQANVVWTERNWLSFPRDVSDVTGPQVMVYPPRARQSIRGYGRN